MTDNFGFLPSPCANINLIRDNLHDRYRDIYAIVKELVQNADDAEATRLDIAWTQGLAGADHPLLQGPAIVVVNDGPFDDGNDRAIRQLGLSDRANQKATIGKFGLGLKSIFHLCEAFFYLASSHSVSSPGDPSFARVFNPWSGGNDTDIHQDWNQFAPSDQTRIITHLQGFLDTPHWFSMWVPLRSKEHMGGYDAISPEWPGDDDRPPAAIFTTDVGVQLANILPMLQSLREIRTWIWREDRKEFGRLFAARLDDGAARRHDVANGQPGLWPLGGRLVVESESSGTPQQAVRIPYAGEEALLDAPSFRELQSDQAWPRYTVIDGAGKPLIAPEKAQPHGAVYFTSVPAQADGALLRSNAVFLPVGDPQQTGKCLGQRDIWLTLHGYYFVDAGRSRLAGNPLADESAAAEPEVESDPASTTIQARWNRRLTDEAVLPLVLPALSHFVAEANLSAGQTRSLTAALMQSRLYRHHRAAICSQQQWVCCYNGEDTRPAWRLIGADVPIYELPSPPETEPQRPFEVMPALRDICKTQAVTISRHSLPRLTRDEAYSWPAPLLRKMLDLPVSTVFRSQGQLEYLAAFLDAQTEQGDASASNVVGRLVEGLVFKALREVGIAELRKNRALMQRIVRHVPAERRYAIGSIDSTHADLLQSLVRFSSSLLLIPKEFNPSDTPATGALAERDAEQLLAYVAPTLAERRDDAEWAEACEQIAVQTLDALEGKKAQFLARCDHYAVFTGYRCATAAESALSLRELREARGRRTLFTYTAGGSKFGLAVELQQALHSGDVVVIRRDVADCLFGIGVLSFCNEESCIRALAAGPLLADVTGRAALLDRLQGRLDETHIPIDLKMGLRYLLHGQAAHAGHDETLFVDSDDSAAWGRLAALALHQHNESWRVVPWHILSYLKPRYRPLLDIRPMTASIVSELLASCDLSALTCAEFTIAEREAFLLGIEDTAVLKALRIHDALDGTLVAIDDCTYIRDGFDLPPDLASAITIVRPSAKLDVLVRQKDLAPMLNAGAAIKIALSQAGPHRYWCLIMDALGQMKQMPSAGSPFGQQLRETAWLPTIHGTPVCPNDVIDLTGADDEIARVVSLSEGAYVTVQTLGQDVRDHNAYRVLRGAVIPPPTQAVTLLGMIMSGDARYRVGLAQPEDADLDAFLEAFEDAPNELMPTWPLLRALRERVKEVGTESVGAVTDEDVRKLWMELRQNLSAERLVNTLGYLRAVHQSSTGRRAKAALRVHNWYLQEVRAHMPSSILPHIELLSRQGAWAPTSALCYADDAGNVAATCVLDKEQETCLGQMPSLAHSAQTRTSDEVDQSPADLVEYASYTAQDVAQAAILLEHYFRDWSGSVPEEFIGAFLCLLGDDQDILALAGRYLDTGQRTVCTTREMFGWTPIMQTTAQGYKVGGYGEDIHDAMVKQRVVVCVDDAANEQVAVTNLLSQPFLARISDQLEAESLLVGARGKSLPGHPYRLRLLHLRHIAVEAATPSRLIALLCETAARVLRDWYWQEPNNLDEVWDSLGQTGQLDIEIARGMLLHSAFGYLRQLGLRDNQRIGRVLSKWESALKRKIEEEQAEQVRKTAIRKIAENAMFEAREDLARLLEDDAEAQALILTGIRTKIHDHYQYALRSIPFELFQNADDAVVELGELLFERDVMTEHARRFVVVHEAHGLTFAHWGRAINQHSAGGSSLADRGFDLDLHNMLVLSSSYKGDEADSPRVTGKFGLGFKSVFLATDRPIILSGRLGVSVLGGFLPRRLDGQEMVRLRDKRTALAPSPDGRKGTLIELPWRGDGSFADETLGEFRDLAHVLVVFARRIKRCEILYRDDRSEIVQWAEHPVAQIQNASVGRLLPIGSRAEPGRGLVLRGRDGAVLLTLGPRGVVPLSDGIPSIWVTAPTCMRAKLGFAVNGPFDLDVGRTQLASESAANDEKAERIGHSIGNTLCELFDAAAADWDGFRTCLDLAGDATQYDFWGALWDRLSYPLSRPHADISTNLAVQLATRMVAYGDRVGLGQLVSQQPALPTKLWGDYAMLTAPTATQAATSGCLDTEDVFRRVASWSPFRVAYQPGTIISRAVHDALSRLGLDAEPARTVVTLADAISCVCGDQRRVPKETAHMLGALITPLFLATLQSGTQAERSEHDGLLETLGTLRFLGRDGHYHPARELLTATGGGRDAEDERRRAAFAPPDRVLAPEYVADEQALRFFHACRQAYSAPVDEMAGWAIASPDDGRRHAALDYLLTGELSVRFAEALRSHLSGSWLAELDNESHYMAHRLWQQRDQILSMLWLHQPQVWSGPDTPVPAPHKRDVADILADVETWWQNKRHDWIAQYDARIYPDHQPLPLKPYVTDADRSMWLELFMLATRYTMGYVLPSQHRRFVEICKQQGWLDVFAATPPRAEDWLGVIEEFVRDRADTTPYFHWAKQIVPIYVLARWLPEYVEVFLGIERRTEPFPLDYIVRPRTDPVLSGGGPDAPPIDKAIGIGACFMVRELARAGVLTTPLAHAHCYVPSRRIRDLFNYAFDYQVCEGYQGSRDIYDFLAQYLGSERATFGLSFDLPFIALAESLKRGDAHAPCIFEDDTRLSEWMWHEHEIERGVHTEGWAATGEDAE